MPTIRLLADENLDGNIIRGLARRVSELDLVRVQDVGLRGASDPEVLAWAADQERVLVTHDVATVTRFALARVEAGQAMPGVIEVIAAAPIGRVIEDLVVVLQCCAPAELDLQVLYLPL